MIAMLDPLIRFILSRVATDYVRLYRAGHAPSPERYAEVYPEYAEAVVRDILFTKYRLRYETISTLSVEDFLNEHPAYWNDEEVLLRLLEHELEHAPAAPDAETVRGRFPHVDPNRLTLTVEIVQLRREWNAKKKVIPNTNPPVETKAETVATSLPPESGGVGLSLVRTANTTNTTNLWSPEQAKSIEWSVQQPAQPDIDATEDFFPADLAGTPAPPPKQDEPEEPQTFTVIDSLTVENFIGKGFWKDVYKAKQHSTQQFVALKHLREKNDAECESLIREVRTQAALTHQNIPPVFALDILPTGQAIVVEKLVDGSRWSDTINSRTIEDNLRILLEVANAVAFAHQQHKIIHRDLKPDNVVINDKYDEVYVIDWGLAADVGEVPSDSDDRVPHVSQLSSIAGTPLYWAPEQADGTPSRCCPATDVFLLGALLYEILTGYAPYRICDPNQIKGLTPQDIEEIHSLEVGPMLRAVRGIIIPPRLFAPGRYIPEELLAVAMKSMSLLPEDRYIDAGGFIDAVKQYQHFSLITSRCDQNWRQFNALRLERDQTLDQPGALLSLTLRFLETSDIFRNVASELQLHKIADAVDSEEVNSQILDAPAHPTLLSAQRGEVEARTELIALTLRSGDLTLADAQIGLVECNPFHDTETMSFMRNDVRALKTSRRRARMMKWVAVGLLGIFLGTSTLYGYWINVQYKKTAFERHRAEGNLQKARSAVNTFFTNVAKNPDIKDAGLMQFRRDLLGLARQYHEDFMTQRSDDPGVTYEQISSLFDMAGIVTQFGDHYDAIDYYLRAIDFGNELMEKYPNNDRYLDIVAKCYKDLGIVYGKAGYPPEQALNINLKALAINRRLVTEFGDVAEYHRNLARVLHNLGLWEMKYGTGDKAEKYFQESLGIRDGMSGFDDPPEYHFGKAQTHFALAVLFVDGERFLEADHEFEMASSFLDDLHVQYPDRFRNDEINLSGAILFGRGEMKLTEGQSEVARSYLFRALEPFSILVEKAPEHIGYQRQLNDAFQLVFECLVHENRSDDALELFQQREESLLETAALFPEIVQFLCKWYLRIAEFHLERGQNEEAIQALRSGLEPLDALEDYRTSEEEELRKKIWVRLSEILDGQ